MSIMSKHGQSQMDSQTERLLKAECLDNQADCLDIQNECVASRADSLKNQTDFLLTRSRN